MEAEGEKAKGLSKPEVAGATGPRNTGGAAPWSLDGILAARALGQWCSQGPDRNPCR